MLYWLMDLRYLALANELMYCRYLNLKGKHEEHNRKYGNTGTRDREEFIDLHLKKAVFSPSLRQQKREENGENGVRTRGLH